MKTYKAEFFSHHSTLPDRNVTVTFLAKDLERARSRIVKELHGLNLLPNPQSHTAWNLRTLTEIPSIGGK